MPIALDDYNLLIVSDLHLSAGRNPGTKKFSRNEDFFFDEEFSRFLEYYQDQGRWQGKKWHLIINGDFLDLLQVTSHEDAPRPLHRDSKHPDYGLDCGEQETVYKVGKIAQGHWHFFEALAMFVVDGNVVTVSKGNHDVEFHYRSVQAALIQEIQAAYKNKLEREGAAVTTQQVDRINVDSVRFVDWFYYEENLLWVEHGKQYDEVNCFKYWLSPLLPAVRGWPEARRNEIDLPWGSLFVRYLFNKIERVEPFADNIKPQTKFVSWMVRKHPITAVSFVYRDGCYMLSRMRRAWHRVKPQSYADREKEHMLRLQQLAQDSGIAVADLEFLDHMRSPSVLKEPSGWIWKSIRRIVLWRLFFPLLTLSLALIVLASVLAVAPFLGVLLPAAVQSFLWAHWVSTSIGPEIIATLSAMRWLALVPVIAAIWWFSRWLLTGEEKKRLSYLAVRARQIREQLKVKYVIMGHTHDADLQSIGEKGEEYFNTGTWTKVFSEEERLIRKDVEFVFVQALRKGTVLQVKLLEWDDGAGEPRLLKLFDGNRPRREHS
jgi:UDP-2,3-diacylglucosamine pyrophosphatase LpxH